jgi:hypothetical protein
MLKGEYMKKYARIIVAVTFLLGLSVAANAEIRGQVVVKLPFEFVASGITFPAGTYTVKRFSQQPFDTLMLTSDDKGTSVFVRPVEMEEASDDTPKVSFHKVGEQHFLSAIETADYIYNFTVSKSVLLEAAAKQRDIAPGSASGGSK